jgi:hypothetical protein
MSEIESVRIQITIPTLVSNIFFSINGTNGMTHVKATNTFTYEIPSIIVGKAIIGMIVTTSVINATIFLEKRTFISSLCSLRLFVS